MSPPDKLDIPVGAEPRQCKGCNTLIYFVRNQYQRITPVEADGTPHHTKCPKADQFRKARQDPVQEQIAKEQKEMLDMLGSRSHYLSDWEVEFVANCINWMKGPTSNLSSKQASTLRDVYEKHCQGGSSLDRGTY